MDTSISIDFESSAMRGLKIMNAPFPFVKRYPFEEISFPEEEKVKDTRQAGRVIPKG